MTKNNLFLIIFLILLIFYFSILINIFKPYQMSQPQILGFQINGIGNGHLTQALTVYKVLIKKYKIPIVIIYGRNEGYDNVFSQSRVIYQKIYTTQESINDMKLLRTLKDIVKIKPSRKYENEYGVNKWFNFFVSDFFNFRTKQIQIANQFSVDNIMNDILINTTKFLSNCVSVSIHLPSKHSKYTIPPLINLIKINRNNINKKLLLAYSVSGQDFPKKLECIAKQNPTYQIKYFTNTKIEIKLSKNITIYKPDKLDFYKYLQICGAVLSTSGDTLPCECAFNSIPSAIMPCSKKHYEQVYNIKKYVKNLKYSELLTDSLDLEYLINKNMKESNLNIIKSLKNRNNQILNLCNI